MCTEEHISLAYVTTMTLTILLELKFKQDVQFWKFPPNEPDFSKFLYLYHFEP